jgi:hypothetical protein
MDVDRRGFLTGVTVLAGGALGTELALAQPGEGGPPGWLPQQDPAVVKEMVGISHADVKRVRELVERQPALVNATIDWGFGDWETALGAASHVGRREIAEFLLANGAHPTLFSAAMLGQLDVVKALVSANPGIQRTLGPHGINLLSHARAGGPAAAEVVAYLQTVDGADRRLPTEPLADGDRDAVVGEYAFGPGPQDRFFVDFRKELGIERPGQTRRFLFHTGGLLFFPSGVPSVKIAFAREGNRATQLTVADPNVFLTAKRRA